MLSDKYQNETEYYLPETAVESIYYSFSETKWRYHAKATTHEKTYGANSDQSVNANLLLQLHTYIKYILGMLTDSQNEFISLYCK